MKTLSLALLSGLSLISSASAAYMPTLLPDFLASGSITTLDRLFGSVFSVDPGSAFKVTGLVFHDFGADGFADSHKVGLYKETAPGSGIYNLTSAQTTFTAASAGTSTTIDGYSFREKAVGGNVNLVPGNYFIGFTNATNNSDALIKNGGNPFGLIQGAAGATATNSIFTIPGITMITANNVNNPGLGLPGSIPAFTVTTLERGNLNVFANLVAVPEVGSLVMGGVMTMLGAGYRRRRSAQG